MVGVDVSGSTERRLSRSHAVVSRYIYQNETGGVHDYLCNKLYELSEHKIELYLSQFCQLIVTRPGSSLERVIVDLCSKSLRIAVKVGD